MPTFRDDAQDDSLAQPVEHIPFKDGVLGSNPRRITKIIVNGFRVVDDFFIIDFGTHNSGISISLQCISNPTAVGLEIDYNYSLSSS